jgi:hypothetical protein
MSCFSGKARASQNRLPLYNRFGFGSNTADKECPLMMGLTIRHTQRILDHPGMHIQTSSLNIRDRTNRLKPFQKGVLRFSALTETRTVFTEEALLQPKKILATYGEAVLQAQAKQIQERLKQTYINGAINLAIIVVNCFALPFSIPFILFGAYFLFGNIQSLIKNHAILKKMNATLKQTH